MFSGMVVIFNLKRNRKVMILMKVIVLPLGMCLGIVL